MKTLKVWSSTPSSLSRFYSHSFPAAVSVRLPSHFHPNEALFPLKQLHGAGKEDAGTARWVHPQLLTFSVSLHPPLFYPFRCSPVHVTVDIRKLSLNCCRCQWLSCPPRVLAPLQSSKAQALISPAREMPASYAAWAENVGVTKKRGAKVRCTQGKVREEKREQEITLTLRTHMAQQASWYRWATSSWKAAAITVSPICWKADASKQSEK